MSAVWSNQNCDSAGEHATLVGDLVGEHDVEHRHAVARDHQQPVVADLVELAHLARVEVRQRRSAHRVTVASGVASIAVELVEHAADVGERALQVEARVEARVVEHRAHVGVGDEQLAERALFLPRAHRVALHDPVRVVAARARLDEREQHRLAEHEPERRVEVAQHALGIHAQARRSTFVNCTST